MIKYFLPCLLIPIALSTYGQRIRGFIYDDISGGPMGGVKVSLEDSVYETTSDSTGHYEFDEVESGRYKITATHPNYLEKVAFDIWARNGKVISQNLALAIKPSGLVKPTISELIDLSEIGSMIITEEQLNRFPATFNDPARQVIIAPDLTIVNDRNNRVSVRGISPDYNTWRLQDVEIVNPNHLTNQGTLSDQPAATGGGINILSSQMLEKSSFLYGDFSAEYGNSIGGIFDMHLKKGKKQQRQHTAQASFLGFDFAAEGPFRLGGNASYIFNYRYSLGGLLAAFNPTESIGFQDLSFNINKPLGDKGNISLFGIGGASFDRIKAKELEESNIVKDRSDRDYAGRMGAIGTRLNWRMGKGILKASAAYSGSGHALSQITYSIPSRRFFSPNYDNNSTGQQQSIISTNTSYRFSIWNSIIHIGNMYNHYLNRHDYNYRNDFSSVDYNTHLLNPYISVELPISQNILIETGLSGKMAYWHIDNRLLPAQSGYIAELFNKPYEEITIDPRIKLTIGSANNSRLYLAVGMYSQLLDHSNYFFVYESNAGEFVEINRSYKLQRSYRYILGVSGRNSIRRISFELFFNHFPEISGSSSGGYNYLQISPVNSLELFSARSYGISMMGSRSFSDNWFSNIGGSVFNSTWSNDKPNRFNSRFNFNFSGGKGWKYQRKGSKESFIVSINGIFQEGMKEPGEVIGLVTTDNSIYYRIDLRIMLTRPIANRTTSLSLDLQNITFRKNDAFHMDNPFHFGPETEQQRGFTPILAYRIEF